MQQTRSRSRYGEYDITLQQRAAELDDLEATFAGSYQPTKWRLYRTSGAW